MNELMNRTHWVPLSIGVLIIIGAVAGTLFGRYAEESRLEFKENFPAQYEQRTKAFVDICAGDIIRMENGEYCVATRDFNPAGHVLARPILDLMATEPMRLSLSNAHKCDIAHTTEPDEYDRMFRRAMVETVGLFAPREAVARGLSVEINDTD